MNSSAFPVQNSEAKWVCTRTIQIPLRKLTGIVVLLLLLTGCANYGIPKNVPIPDSSVA